MAKFLTVANTSETAVEDFSKFHLQQTGFEGESDDADCHHNTADSWQEAESQGPGVDARHAPNSSTGVHLESTGRSEQAIVANISAYVEAAYSMLPFSPPKPIWEQGFGLTFLVMDSFLVTVGLRVG